jgi:hypothetical protein
MQIKMHIFYLPSSHPLFGLSSNSSPLLLYYLNNPLPAPSPLLLPTFSLRQVRTELKDVGEVIHHKKDMTKLSQQIENETSDIFDSLADINVMLRDYIIDVNDVITDTITKQYQYDFDQFDAKYFKTKIINKITRLNADIDYVMINEHCFEQISDKVLDNVRKYITELKYIKDLENGKRRSEFKELTLSLTKKITYHSIDIFKNFKQTA